MAGDPRPNTVKSELFKEDTCLVLEPVPSQMIGNQALLTF